MAGQTRTMLRDLVDLWGRCELNGRQFIRRIAPMGFDPECKPGVVIHSDQFGSLPVALRRAFTGTLMSMSAHRAGRGSGDEVLPGVDCGGPERALLFSGLSNRKIVSLRQKATSWPQEYQAVALAVLEKLEVRAGDTGNGFADQKCGDEQKSSGAVAEIRSPPSVAADYLRRAKNILDSPAGRKVLRLQGRAQQKALRRLARAELKPQASN